MEIWKWKKKGPSIFPEAEAKGTASASLLTNEILILAYPENMVKIRLMVEAMDTFCRRGGEGMEGEGMGRDSIDNLSPSFWL